METQAHGLPTVSIRVFRCHGTTTSFEIVRARVRRFDVDDDHWRKFGLSRSGEWIPVPEGEPYPEVCYLPVGVTTLSPREMAEFLNGPAVGPGALSAWGRQKCSGWTAYEHATDAAIVRVDIKGTGPSDDGDTLYLCPVCLIGYMDDYPALQHPAEVYDEPA